MRTKKEVQDYLESVQDDWEKYGESADEKEATIMEIQMETLEWCLGDYQPHFSNVNGKVIKDG